MSRHLVLSFRFLSPWFHGRGDEDAPEWPPSPLRAFQAVVAAAAGVGQALAAGCVAFGRGSRRRRRGSGRLLGSGLGCNRRGGRGIRLGGDRVLRGAGCGGEDQGETGCDRQQSLHGYGFSGVQVRMHAALATHIHTSIAMEPTLFIFAAHPCRICSTRMPHCPRGRPPMTFGA